MVNVKDFGAVGNGATDDTDAINNAISRLSSDGGGLCWFPYGVYMINNAGVTLHGGVTLAAETGAVLKALTPFEHSYNGLLHARGMHNWQLRGLTFDMQSFVGSAVACRDCDEWSVNQCQFVNLFNWGVSAMTVNGWLVKDCLFVDPNPGTTQTSGKAGIIVMMAAPGDHGTYHIMNNRMTGTDIAAGRRDVIVSGNIITGVTAGCGIFTVKESERLLICDNICKSGRGQDANRTWVLGYEFWGRNLVVRGNIAHDNDGGGLAFGCKNSIIADNLCYDNGRQTGYAGVTARYIDEEYNASGSLVIGNRCFDSLGVNGTQKYGFSYQRASLISSVVLGRNHFAGNKIADIQHPRP